MQEVVPAGQRGGRDTHLEVVWSKQLHEQKHTALGIDTDTRPGVFPFPWSLRRMVMGMLVRTQETQCYVHTK